MNSSRLAIFYCTFVFDFSLDGLIRLLNERRLKVLESSKIYDAFELSALSLWDMVIHRFCVVFQSGLLV